MGVIQKETSYLFYFTVVFLSFITGRKVERIEAKRNNLKEEVKLLKGKHKL